MAKLTFLSVELIIMIQKFPSGLNERVDLVRRSELVKTQSISALKNIGKGCELK